MKVKVRADNHFHTATLTGNMAEKIVAFAVSVKCSFPNAKNSENRIIRIEGDYSFLIGHGDDSVKIMLFKGYYLVIEN